MLTTIREYAADRLADAGETDLARQAHLAYVTELAETDPEVVCSLHRGMVEGFVDHSPTAKALFERLSNRIGGANGAGSNNGAHHGGASPHEVKQLLVEMLEGADSGEERARVQALMEQLSGVSSSDSATESDV